MRTDHRHVLAGFLSTLALLAANGCGGLEPVAPYSPVTDPAQLFMALELDHAAVNLATLDGYDELQLTATPLGSRGVPIAGLPAPTFRSSDTTRVWVTPDGLLQARRAATAVQVIAEIVAPGNIRQADTVLVSVLETAVAPPVLDVFTIDPLDPAAANMAMLPVSGAFGRAQLQFAVRATFSARLTLRALDPDSAAITGLVVAYESLSPKVMSVDPRSATLRLLQPGDVDIVVRTTAYGVRRADTAHFTVTLPQVHGVIIEPDPNGGAPKVEPRTISIRPGGYAFFSNSTPQPVQVIFENPEAATAIPELCAAIGADYSGVCDDGNIPDFMQGSVTTFPARFYALSRGRQFLEPGEYPYRIEPLGVTGTIIVSDVAQ